jgi:gliding motility-associated-like protein
MMRKLLFVAASLLFVQANYAQCVTEAFLDVDTIDCGDSVNVTINSFARSLLTEVFTPTGPSDPGWSQTAGAIYTNPFIPSPTNDTYFWMGATNVLPALLQSDPFNVQFGGQICFDFVYAIQGGAAPIEGPDLSEEGITLQYSIDNGLTWNDIVYMQPNGEFLPSNPGPGNPMTNPPFDAAGTPFTVWNSVCFPLPPGALTSATSFQWIQEFNSGACCDHWGLDNIQILAADPAYGLFDEAGNFLPSNQFALSPTADSTYTFLYTNGIDDSCTTTATVTLNPTDAGPDIMVACDGLGTNLMANGVAPWSSVTWSPATGLTDPTDPNTFALPLVDTDYELTSDCGVDTVTVFVEDSYVINITPPDTICLNGSTFLNLTTSPSSVPIASVEWSSPGTLNSPTGNQVLASPTVTTQYIATVTSDSGCVIQDSVTLVVQGFASSIEVTPSDPSVCSGSSVNLTADIVANPSPYTLIQGTYNPYPTTGGTAITGLSDDNTVGPFNIGFTFPFFGNFYNSFWLSSNGFMTFTNPTGSFLGNANIPNGAQPNNIIAWAWDDMNFNAGGTVNYYTGGTAGNQFMVINFINVPHFGGAPGTEVSVQVVIYQSGLVEINNINVVPDSPFGTMTQGIENANGSEGVAEQTFNNTNFTSIAENYSFVPISGPVNPVYTWSPPLYLNDTTGQTVTSTPEGDIEYFVTMVDGICSSTTSVFVNIDSLVFLGDLDYFLECPEDSFQFNVQFETNIFNNLSNGPCTLGGSGVFTLGQVGAGTASTGAPTPYEGFWEDGRMQVIYTAAELNAAGFTGGELESIAFNVTNKASTAPYNNFTVRVQPTTLTTLTNFINAGFTTVVNPYAHTTALGWNWHVFDNSFCWDGVTDLLFEVCFDNADWTSDDDVEYTNSASNQVVYDFTDGAAGCTLPNATASNQKPNLQFNYENLVGGLAPIVAQWSPSAAFVNDIVENPILILADMTAQYPVTIAAGNCVNTDTVTVSFGAGYTLTNDTAVCDGESVQLNANGGSNHVWTPDNGTLTSTTIPNPVATPTGTTDYIVSLDLTNCSIQDTVTITVNPLPVSTINGGAAEEVVCDGSIASLVSTADPNWNNEWTGPETGTGVSLDLTTEGIYVLTSTDANGCVSSSSIVVGFYDNPALNPDAVRNILCCAGDEVVIDFASLITNNVDFGEAYWDNSSTPAGANLTIASNDDGTYDLRIVSLDGCETITQLSFETNCINPDIVDVDSVIFGTTEVYVVEGDYPITNEVWTPSFTGNEFLAITAANEFETVVVNAEAEFVLNDGSTHICTEIDSSQVYIFLPPNPEMPDAFTPNGDNLNDVLFPVNIDPATRITAFKVFNRWGDVVYEYNGDNGWDGTFESEKQPADVYNYYLVIDKISSELVLSGSVTLIR